MDRKGETRGRETRDGEGQGRIGTAYEGVDWPAFEWRPGGRVASRRQLPHAPTRTPDGALSASTTRSTRAASSRESSPRGWSSSPSSSPKASTTRAPRGSTTLAADPPNDLPPRGSPSVSPTCSETPRRATAVRANFTFCAPLCPTWTLLPGSVVFSHGRRFPARWNRLGGVLVYRQLFYERMINAFYLST